jgi:hypothetical protein
MANNSKAQIVRVERYTPIKTLHGTATMIHQPETGEWVRYEDYVAVRDALTAEQARIKDLHDACTQKQEIIDSHAAVVAELEARGQTVEQDYKHQTCNDCKRQLPWWGVDEAGRCGRCYESMNITRERKSRKAAEQALAKIRKITHSVAINGGWGERHAERLAIDVRQICDEVNQ